MFITLKCQTLCTVHISSSNVTELDITGWIVVQALGIQHIIGLFLQQW